MRKAYSNGKEVTYINVDLKNRQIEYDNKIVLGDKTVKTLSRPENLVVLECVDRLITKGYLPQHIHLEKRWKLGRTAKGGKADIIVSDHSGNTLLIIECKTAGMEYQKEKDLMKETGGQLFSYFQQDKNARFLCLYTSEQSGAQPHKAKSIRYENAIIDVRDTKQWEQKEQNGKAFTYGSVGNLEELLDVWRNRDNRAFLQNGIFDDEVLPYSPGFIPITIGDLECFSENDAKEVYKEFEEILRHHNISDRSNAFNRFISLILAKIVDETKGDNEIADFQVMYGRDDNPEFLHERLEKLYSDAMRIHLKESVIRHTEDEINKVIDGFPRQTAKDEIRRILRELKFYKNNEFAFKEIYNERLFYENAKVLYEIVELLQKYRFRFERKNQLLSDFFEQMLENGYKQSEGQFFTPTPLARFTVLSLPFDEIIAQKIKNNKEHDFLPYTIDYACGSGHFITEAIEHIQNAIRNLQESEYKPNARRQLQVYKKSTAWAGQYIYGIEKDYRLARTSQVACFMHGDGDANIIFGDGLTHWEDGSADKTGKMLPKGLRGVGIFDVLVANPPYTIKGFKKHMDDRDGKRYDLWRHINPKSDDIEVLFLERAKQLLKPGGVAGIFMPQSILSNENLYGHARRLLMMYFEIIAIVEFRKKTFSATDTTTVVLFLKRRDDSDGINCRYIAEDIILHNNERAGDFVDSNSLFASFANYRGIALECFKSFVGRQIDNRILETSFYTAMKDAFEKSDYAKHIRRSAVFKRSTAEEQENKINDAFFDFALQREAEKFRLFLLCHKLVRSDVSNGDTSSYSFEPQQTLIIKSDKLQKDFLGYSFREKRGYSGIIPNRDIFGNLDTALYDENNSENPEKISSHIRHAFMGQYLDEMSVMTGVHLVKHKLYDLFNFVQVDLDWRIYQHVYNDYNVPSEETQWPMVTIGELCSGQSGGTPLRSKKEFYGGNIPWAKIKDIDACNGRLLTTNESITEAGLNSKEVGGKIFPIGSVLLSIYASIGKVAISGIEFSANQAILVLNTNDSNRLDNRYLFYWLENDIERLKAFSYGSSQDNLSKKVVMNFAIPLPPLHIQRKIIAECELVDSESIELDGNTLDLRNTIESIRADKKRSIILSYL